MTRRKTKEDKVPLSLEYWINYLDELEAFKENPVIETYILDITSYDIGGKGFNDIKRGLNKDITLKDHAKIDAEIYRVKTIIQVLKHQVDTNEI